MPNQEKDEFCSPIHFETLTCKVCKKQIPRFRTDLYVYHESFGVACIHHHGVQEWYDNLFQKAFPDCCLYRKR